MPDDISLYGVGKLCSRAELACCASQQNCRRTAVIPYLPTNSSFALGHISDGKLFHVSAVGHKLHWRVNSATSCSFFRTDITASNTYGCLAHATKIMSKPLWVEGDCSSGWQLLNLSPITAFLGSQLYSSDLMHHLKGEKDTFCSLIFNRSNPFPLMLTLRLESRNFVVQGDL